MDEFEDVIRLLHEHRPEATALELDEIKQRVRRRATQPSRRRNFMKSRLAILTMLIGGMLFTTTGAGLALTNLSNGTDASVAQYGTTTPTPTPTGGQLPHQQSHKPQHPTTPQGGLQPARQVETGASQGQLPFTGFAAIPVLLGGLLLLTAGLVLRRRTRGERE